MNTISYVHTGSLSPGQSFDLGPPIDNIAGFMGWRHVGISENSCPGNPYPTNPYYTHLERDIYVGANVDRIVYREIESDTLKFVALDLDLQSNDSGGKAAAITAAFEVAHGIGTGAVLDPKTLGQVITFFDSNGMSLAKGAEFAAENGLTAGLSANDFAALAAREYAQHARPFPDVGGNFYEHGNSWLLGGLEYSADIPNFVRDAQDYENSPYASAFEIDYSAGDQALAVDYSGGLPAFVEMVFVCGF